MNEPKGQNICWVCQSPMVGGICSACGYGPTTTTPINPLSPQQQATREAWRYHFAGQAMAAIVAGRKDDLGTMNPVAICETAVLASDALLAELERTKP